VRVPLAALEELRAKYAQMLAMRVAHTSGDEDPDEARAFLERLEEELP